MLFPCGGVLSERGTLWSLNCGVYSKTDKRQEYLPQSAPTVTKKIFVSNIIYSYFKIYYRCIMRKK